MKKFLLSLLVASGLAATAGAQTKILPCGTDQLRAQMVAQHPEILKYEQQFEKEYQRVVADGSIGRFLASKSGAAAGDTIDVPIVVHVLHNYGNEFVSDNSVYNAVDNWTQYYLTGTNNASGIIPVFQPYIGVPKFRFHLATKDPQGNPTHGITRHFTYLTYHAASNTKIGQWDPTSYVNIWIFASFDDPSGGGNGIVLANATPPSQAAATPFYDGVNANASYFNDGSTIPHELGHIFSLSHTWGDTNSPEEECGDDGVDDTPPHQRSLL